MTAAPGPTSRADTAEHPGCAEDGSGQRALVQLAQAGRERAAPGPMPKAATADQSGRAEDGSGQRVLVQLAQAGPGRGAVEETALRLAQHQNDQERRLT